MVRSNTNSPNVNIPSNNFHNIVEISSQICHNAIKDSIYKEGIQMKESLNYRETDSTEPERLDVEAPKDLSIVASDAIKYTAYIMLLFGFLYFLVAYLGPML